MVYIEYVCNIMVVWKEAGGRTLCYYGWKDLESVLCVEKDPARSLNLCAPVRCSLSKCFIMLHADPRTTSVVGQPTDAHSELRLGAGGGLIAQGGNRSSDRRPYGEIQWFVAPSSVATSSNSSSTLTISSLSNHHLSAYLYTTLTQGCLALYSPSAAFIACYLSLSDAVA